MKSRSLQQRAASGVVVGTVGLVLNLLQAIVQVPILLHFWDTQTYGLWGTLLATIGLVTSLDTGHQNYLGNRFCEHWVQSQDRLKQELASGIRAAVGLASLEILVGIGIIAFGGLAWLGTAPGQVNQGAILGAVALYLVYWAVFGAVGGILVRLYAPAGFFDRGQWFGIVSRLLAFLALITAASLGGSVLEAMAAQVLVGTVFNLYLLWSLHRQFPALTPWWKGGDWTTAWRNFRLSLVLTANGFVEQMAANGLVLLVGRMLSPVSVALFTTVRTVANLANQGASILLNPLAPDLVRYHVTREGGKLTAVFATSWFLGTSLVTAGLVSSVYLLEPLYQIWTRGVLPFDRVLFAYLGAAIAIRQWAAPSQSYIANMNRLKPQFYMALSRVLCCLPLVAWLLPHMGLAGAGLGALVGEACAAAIAHRAAQMELLSVGTQFPVKAAFASLMQIVVSGGVLGAFSCGAGKLGLFAGIGSFLVAGLALFQWFGLPNEVKNRLRDYLKIRRQSMPRAI